ncbi:MAG: hypothetical protein WCO00_00580 [Rhodospirillaceae bacterium]
MSEYSNYYPLPPEVVHQIRKADTFTGSFASAISGSILLTMKEFGLTDGRALTDLGMAVRRWLFLGTENAPDEVANLLRTGEMSGVSS